MNMSYCRFYNTSLDFKECLEAYKQKVDGYEEGDEPLSSEEERACARLLVDAANMVMLAYEEGMLDADTARDLADVASRKYVPSDE
jgi:hypothetical protein